MNTIKNKMKRNEIYINNNIISDFKVICRDIQLNKKYKQEIIDDYSHIKDLIEKDESIKRREVNIYIQGSGAQNTFIEPLNGKQFDVDFVVEYSTKEQYQPKDFFDSFYNIFKNHSKKVEKKNNTIRIYFEKYHFDIMPGIYIDSYTLKVPNKTNGTWEIRLPKLLVDWFTNPENKQLFINKKYENNIKKSKHLKGKNLKCSQVTDIENIFPNFRVKGTKLTMVTQLLKRCRDIYFNNCDENIIPQSIIIYIFTRKFFEDKESLYDCFVNVIIKLNLFLEQNEKFEIFIVDSYTNQKEVLTKKWSEDERYYVNFKIFINEVLKKLKSLNSNNHKRIMMDLFGDIACKNIKDKL